MFVLQSCTFVCASVKFLCPPCTEFASLQSLLRPFVALLIRHGALLSASITPQTRAPLRWSGPGRSTCLFFWWGTGAALWACWRAGQRGSDSRRCHSAPGHNQRCNCVRCPGRALPTAGSPSDRGECRQGTGCAGRWKTEASYTQKSTGKKTTDQVLKSTQVNAATLSQLSAALMLKYIWKLTLLIQQWLKGILKIIYNYNSKHADMSSGLLLSLISCCFEAEHCFSVRKSAREKQKH